MIYSVNAIILLISDLSNSTNLNEKLYSLILYKTQVVFIYLLDSNE